MNFQFSILNFQFSILDIVGATIGLFFIISEYRAGRWFWPLSLLMSVFYAIIYFQAHYYANGGLCCYNFAMSIYGLLVWRGIIGQRPTAERENKPITSCPRKYWLWIILAVAVFTVVLAQLLGALKESQQPWLDGLTSAISVVGMYMVSQKWWQQWFCWIVVNPIMVYLFFASGNYASSVLYIIFCIFCILGIIRWQKASTLEPFNPSNT